MLSLGAALCFTSCKKDNTSGPKEVSIDKITKWGNRTFSYDANAKLTCIAEYEGEDYSKCWLEYNGNTVNVMDEEKWGDWKQEKTLTFVLKLNEAGYVNEMTVKKESGDYVYSFTYENDIMKSASVKIGSAAATPIITADFAKKSWTQLDRNFEDSVTWDKTAEKNATQFITFGTQKNVGGFPFILDYRRDPKNEDLKIEKMFVYAGLFGKAPETLPTAAVWKKADGSALAANYCEVTTEYFYKFDKAGRVSAFATEDKAESYTEISWETFVIKK